MRTRSGRPSRTNQADWLDGRQSRKSCLVAVASGGSRSTRWGLDHAGRSRQGSSRRCGRLWCRLGNGLERHVELIFKHVHDLFPLSFQLLYATRSAHVLADNSRLMHIGELSHSLGSGLLCGFKLMLKIGSGFGLFGSHYPVSGKAGSATHGLRSACCLAFPARSGHEVARCAPRAGLRSFRT